jgi:hypothetical protein
MVGAELNTHRLAAPRAFAYDRVNQIGTDIVNEI